MKKHSGSPNSKASFKKTLAQLRRQKIVLEERLEAVRREEAKAHNESSISEKRLLTQMRNACGTLLERFYRSRNEIGRSTLRRQLGRNTPVDDAVLQMAFALFDRIDAEPADFAPMQDTMFWNG